MRVLVVFNEPYRVYGEFIASAIRGSRPAVKAEAIDRAALKKVGAGESLSKSTYLRHHQEMPLPHVGDIEPLREHGASPEEWAYQP
jgi:hypothetical protein